MAMYNADEIFEIGVNIEKNGNAFYEAAAQATDDEDAQRLFSDLAQWEAQHIKLFAELKDRLPASLAADDPGFDAAEEQKHRYLKAAADSHVFHLNQDVKKLVTACPAPVDILRLALSFEKDSVVVFTGMKELVPQSLGRDTIDRLIAEEMRHIAIISDQIEVLA